MNRALLAATLALCAFAVASAYPRAMPRIAEQHLGNLGDAADALQEIEDAVNSTLNGINDRQNRTQSVVNDSRDRTSAAADLAAQGWSAQVDALKVQAENSSDVDVSACIAGAKDALTGVSFALDDERRQCISLFTNNLSQELVVLQEVVNESLRSSRSKVKYCQGMPEILANICLAAVKQVVHLKAEHVTRVSNRVFAYLEKQLPQTYGRVDRCTTQAIATRSFDVKRVVSGAEECIKAEINARDRSTPAPEPRPTPAASTPAPEPRPTPAASTPAPEPRPTPAA